MNDYSGSIGRVREKIEPKKRTKAIWKFIDSVEVKNRIVYSFFWGRSNLYKTSLHFIIIFLTGIVLITGFSSNLFSESSQSSSLDTASIAIGDTDLLEQGGTIQTVLVSENYANYRVGEYLVIDGDTLDSISQKFNVSKDTIKWANQNIFSGSNFFDEKINPNDTLLIPEINGILYIVEEGDTVDSVVGKIQNSTAFDIIEINNLKRPDFALTVGSTIFVPGGTRPEPERPVIIPSYTQRDPNYSSVILDPGVIVSSLSGLTFIDPLSHPDCAGYGYSRGFSDWHYGVDLAKAGGCPIRAVEAGTVTYAGWGSTGEGYYVTIDHGNGVKSSYFHGDGNIWVRSGDYVAKGTDLMYMGCTGFCTGTHLHLAMRINGVWIDPAPYVPYYRP